jgi:hypothetical protein
MKRTKRIKPHKKAPAKASLATPLITPHFKPRRLVSEINFHLKVAALACMAVSAGAAQAFEPVVQLSSLDGSTGFRLDGVSRSDKSGYSVSAAGDVNGDGIDDVLIGATQTDFNGTNSGSTYVVFGSHSPFVSAIGLTSLNGSTGFRLDGANGREGVGQQVSAAGDVNGDGIDDLLIGAKTADFNGEINTGSTYVVFGRRSPEVFASTIELSSLNGSTGFRLVGATENDNSGRSVSAAGDVNGDGVDDLLIGAPYADFNGEINTGFTYVVLGRPSPEVFASTIELSSLNGSTGFRLDGEAADGRSGRSVSAAGDVNGDGVDDLLIGAPYTDPNGDSSGSTYVVFGRPSPEVFASTIDLASLNGSTGFRLDGVSSGDHSGASVSTAGDVNGDGIDDLLIAADDANPNDFKHAGSTYVVFGRRSPDGFASTIELSSLNGSTGFRLDGEAEEDYSGISVSAAGDVNGDGIDDLLIGAYYASHNGLERASSSYVVFGSTSSFGPVIDLSSLDGSTGFRLDGVAEYDYSGFSVSAAGDVNADGIDDVLIGAYQADPNGDSSGSTYVVFGAKEDIDETTCFPLKNQTGGIALVCLL